MYFRRSAFAILVRRMDEQKPRRSSDAAYNRRNLYIDGVSRPIAPRPIISPQPTPVVRPSAQRLNTNPENPVTQTAPINNQEPSRFNFEPPKVADKQSPISFLGAALPHDGLSNHKPAFKKRKSRTRRILRYAIIVLLITIVGFGAWFGSSIVGSINKVFHGNVFSDVHALISGSTLNESNGRINILLAGDSVDDPGHQGGMLTDSIMVISYDPANKTGFILSIPRDLWVNIPGWNHEKINAANDVTNFSQPGYPNGGIGQLQEIVQTDLGIPIDYEATIDYTAFRDAVNTVGGITINIQTPDPRGLYDPYTNLRLPNGQVTLNGQQALNLARTRGDGPGAYGIPNADFTRTEHQREMLVALIKKSLSLGVLSNPVKVASLFKSFGSNVTTNLTLGDLTSLLHLSGGLNLSHLQSVTYAYGGPNSLLTSYLAPDGEDALIPALGLDNFTNLQAYYQQLTSSNPISQEAPTVTILNGSDVSGLASREKTVLEAQGFNVVAIADASKVYPSSLIVDNTSGAKPASASQLGKDIKGQTVTSTTGSAEAGEAANYSTDFVVVLGQDWDHIAATGKPVQN